MTISPYNPRATDDPKGIECRAEDRITEHSKDVQLKQSALDKTYNRRTGVERTDDAVKDCGLGHVRAPRPRPRTNTSLPLEDFYDVARADLSAGDLQYEGIGDEDAIRRALTG